MKKLLIILFILFSINSLKAQVSSSCDVPSDLFAAYDLDVKDLSIIRIIESNSPDTSQISLSQEHQDTIWSGLAAIYNAFSIPERDSVFDIYCVHNESGRNSVLSDQLNIGIDASCSWFYNWENLTIYTGNTALDNLLQQYGFSIDDFHTYSSGFTYASFSTDQIINMTALCDSIEVLSTEINFAESGYSMGDSKKSMSYDRIGDEQFYNFRIGWGDCPSGCINKYIWSFKVNYSDCSVEYLGTGQSLGSSQNIPDPDNCNITNTSEIGGNILELSIYPNPAKDFINITIPSLVKESSTIEVLSINGELIESVSVNGREAQLLVEHWNKGLYIIRVKNNESVYTQKVLIK